MSRVLSAIVVVLLAWACSPGTDTVSLDTGQDLSVEDLKTEEVEEVHVAEFATPDVAGDVLVFDVELSFDLADAGFEPGPGEAGYACQSPDQCNEGFCIQTADGKQCTIPCQDECPFGWECVQHTPSLPDQIFICAPGHVDLCRPCRENAECMFNGTDAGQACIPYGPEGAFCGEACESDEDCPDGFVCAQTVDVPGAEVLQCMLLEGVCDCSQWDIDSGASTDCQVGNEFGACPGTRKCEASGLSPCSAAVPQAEVCNGKDDNCNGEADEGTGGVNCPVVNEFGTCPGIEKCENGSTVCEGAQAEPEGCDGLDNDCDGQTDEDFPDTDDDGLADCMESDKDGDGVVDGADNCPSDHNAEQLDSDFDGIGDICDQDDDNDLTPDWKDCAPLDNEVYPGAEELCDGKDNNCNATADEGFPDSDADGWKNCLDDDDDNDNYPDLQDCAPEDKFINPKAQELCDGKDNNCNNLVDESYGDLDQDGIADCVDEDKDGDGVPDQNDNCPETPNEGQADLDGDGTGDACDKDADGDAIPDAVDNCPGVKNTSQSDIDVDGLGDLCDDDPDGDGVTEGDNCPLVANQSQVDTDNDGMGDACEDDADGDGTPNAQDCAPGDPAIYPGAKEVCDGVDNNCNGNVDEGFKDIDGDLLKDCVDNDDDNDDDPDDLDCAPWDAAVNHGAAEVCDGIDNNCNDEVDENIGQLACGKGVCFHTMATCLDGVVQSCDPMEGAHLELCDGKDNDCDGLVDEDLGATTCGLGVCQHTAPDCLAGEPNPCDPMEGATDEACDGQDNNCNGATDEGLGALTCGVGQCLHSTPACIGGVAQQCDPTQGAGVETCDGVDNDCDDKVDEDLGTVMCGEGVCLHEQAYCEAGKIAPCNPFLGVQEEVCDGLDNNCNGLVDDGLGKLSCGKGVCEKTVAVCVDGQEQQCDPLDGAQDETCDGTDNDCDGLVDEAQGLTTCGKGQCEHTVNNCVDGIPQECDPEEGVSDELCDGLDNNCDGFVDEDFDDTDEDGQADCIDTDDDNDGDADVSDCKPLDPAVSHFADEICFNDEDEDCDEVPDNGCWTLSCKQLLADHPDTVSGVYKLDIDAGGPLAEFDAWCDMDNDGGGWTLISSTGSQGGVANYKDFPREFIKVYSDPYGMVYDGNSPCFEIGSTVGGSDKVAYFELDTVFSFTEFRGQWRGYGQSGLHHDDNWNAGSWGAHGASSNGYVMFGTPDKIVKTGGQWGGDWNSGSTEQTYTFDTTTPAAHILRWGVEDQSTLEYVKFNNLDIYVR